MPYIYLELLSGFKTGQRYLLANGATSIGRSSQNTITVDECEKSVSGHHAIVYKSDTSLSVQDLESTNGTYVNRDKVSERDLAIGDVLGFGKAGPRMKLVSSDVELPLTCASSDKNLDMFVDVRTSEDALHRRVHNTSDTTGSDDIDLLAQLEQSRQPASVTMDVERKILEKKLDAAGVQALFANKNRLDKIIDRGNIDESQSTMLSAAHAVHKKTHAKWRIVLCVVLVVSVAIISVLAIKTLRYKALLSQGMSLRNTLDNYDSMIEKANKNPDANRRVLDSLIAVLDAAKAKLAHVKQHVSENDAGKFYESPLEKTIDEVLRRFGESDYHIPREMVERVAYHISVYNGSLHATIAKYIARREKYFPMMRREFAAAGLPADLAYVSMLESGFNPRALSQAGARGMWQFMEPTGRRYGLHIDATTDERCDPDKSTIAATHYFRELIAIFGSNSSVMLAMAAYNAGEGRIVGALRKIDNPMRNRDFWYIYRMGYLAEETNEYIPRIMALIIISEHPDKYGFVNAQTAALTQDDSANDFIPVDDIKSKQPQ